MTYESEKLRNTRLNEMEKKLKSFSDDALNCRPSNILTNGISLSDDIRDFMNFRMKRELTKEQERRSEKIESRFIQDKVYFELNCGCEWLGRKAAIST